MYRTLILADGLAFTRKTLLEQQGRETWDLWTKVIVAWGEIKLKDIGGDLRSPISTAMEIKGTLVLLMPCPIMGHRGRSLGTCLQNLKKVCVCGGGGGMGIVAWNFPPCPRTSQVSVGDLRPGSCYLSLWASPADRGVSLADVGSPCGSEGTGPTLPVASTQPQDLFQGFPKTELAQKV